MITVAQTTQSVKVKCQFVYLSIYEPISQLICVT